MKRFTATEKWDKAWFQALSPRLKCFWLFLCDKADAAGVWDANFGLASYLVGERIELSDMAAFGDRIEQLPGEKFRISAFIEFQYGKLSEACPAHKAVFRTIEKHAAKGNATLTLPIQNPPPRVLSTLQDMDKDKDKEGGAGGNAPIPIPPEIDLPPLREAWDSYVLYRRERKLSKLQASSVRAQFAEFAEWGVERSVAAIKTTIRKGWQGIHEEKPNQTNGRPNTHQRNSGDRNAGTANAGKSSQYAGIGRVVPPSVP